MSIGSTSRMEFSVRTGTRRSRLGRSKIAAAAVSAAAVAAMSLAGAGAASADDSSWFPLVLTGDTTTVVKKLNNTVTFARTNVDTELDGGNVAADGAIPLRGTFVLPSATTKLALGPLNAATIKLTVAEPSALAGTATYVEDGIILDVTQSFKVKIDNIAPLGIGGSGSASSQGTLVGPNCETTVTSAHLTGKVSPLEPEDPDIFLKGSMSGKYTIPAFKNCGLLTPVLTALVSGPDNPLNVNLTLPYVAPTSSVAKTMMAKVQAD